MYTTSTCTVYIYLNLKQNNGFETLHLTDWSFKELKHIRNEICLSLPKNCPVWTTDDSKTCDTCV